MSALRAVSALLVAIFTVISLLGCSTETIRNASSDGDRDVLSSVDFERAFAEEDSLETLHTSEDEIESGYLEVEDLTPEENVGEVELEPEENTNDPLVTSGGYKDVRVCLTKRDGMTFFIVPQYPTTGHTMLFDEDGKSQCFIGDSHSGVTLGGGSANLVIYYKNSRILLIARNRAAERPVVMLCNEPGKTETDTSRQKGVDDCNILNKYDYQSFSTGWGFMRLNGLSHKFDVKREENTQYIEFTINVVG